MIFFSVVLHSCCAAAAKKKSRKKKRLSFRKGCDDVLILTTTTTAATDEKFVDVEAKSDKILSDTLLTLDDAIRNSKPEKKKNPEVEVSKKFTEDGATYVAPSSSSNNSCKAKTRENSKVKESKNCCKHSENSSRMVHRNKEAKVKTENASQQTHILGNNDNGNNDEEDSLIGSSKFIPDHVKSLIPERV